MRYQGSKAARRKIAYGELPGEISENLKPLRTHSALKPLVLEDTVKIKKKKRGFCTM